MPDLVMGAMGSLIPKLYELLKVEYKLQTGVKEKIESLTGELEVAQAVLRNVARVPWDQLDEQVQIWARQVREASYDMEDIVDTFLVRVQSPDSAEHKESLLKRLSEKMANLWPKITVRRKISHDVKDILSHLQEVTDRCRRYKVDDIVVARPATTSTIDPRLHAMYTQVDKLVGIDESSSELKSKLQLDDMSNMKMKTVSIVGIGGLGKTTLAKAVYDNLKADFNYSAFVSVGRNPDLHKVLQMILIALDKGRYEKFNFAAFQHITQFIDELREFLRQNKRYLIVIDDVWEKQSWEESLKLAIADDSNCGGRIIITTRKQDVAENADEVYELPPLSNDSSRKLFYTRIYGDERKYIDYQPDEVSDKILRKCAGIPLAIITMASLLVRKPRDRWFELYKSIGFGCKGNEGRAKNTMRTLSFSYYDLPSDLRTCLLYLSAFPEDYVIPKHSLIWMWVAEGFVQNKEGNDLFETGEGYFIDLVNRSMIQEVEPDYKKNDIHGCRVHDMVLDFIRSMSREENFFIVFDNNGQGTLVRSNVARRLAYHNKTMVHSNQANMFDMSKVRSFISLEWVIDTWAPLSSFKLLRVLNIGIGYYGRLLDGSLIRVEPLGHLLHLRFLGINGRRIEKIPEEIGALKMLQTLDSLSSSVLELPSSSSLPTQLVCLRMSFDYRVRDAEVFSVGRLTSLEELSVYFCAGGKPPRRFVMELGSLRELRVLDAYICLGQDKGTERDLIESVRHLHKLQHLIICTHDFQFLEREMEFVLHGDLRRLVLPGVALWKLPSRINGWCHPNLSHLELCLLYMDKQELKTLGGLPELRFLKLDLRRQSPTICNIRDSDACYFPKLRCLKLLMGSLVLFVANNGDDKKTVSIHNWDGEDDDDDIYQSDDDYDFYVSLWNEKRGPVGEKNDDELQLQRPMAMLSVSHDELPSPFQPSKLQHGTPISDEENKGEGDGVATLRFMPRLQVLHFQIFEQDVWDPRYCNSLSLEFLSSLREINVRIDPPYCKHYTSIQLEEVKAALRRAAQVHPNHPTLRIDTRIIDEYYRPKK